MHANCYFRFLLFSSLILSLTTHLVAAQETSTTRVSPSSSVVKVTPASEKSTEPYEIELLHSRIVFEADGKGSRDMQLRVKVNSEAAVRQFGLLVYPFAYSFESLDVVSARVHKPDGTVVETPGSDVQELDSAVSREAPMYTDEREKHIAVKSLTPGDVLEVHLHWTIHEAIAPGHFWHQYNYFRAGVCRKEILEIDVPRNQPVKLRNADPQPVIRDEGARRVYTFENVNLKKEEESKIPAWEKNYKGLPPPDIQLSSFSSWKEVGDWFEGLAAAKSAVTPEIRAKAEDLTKGKTSDEEKIRALYDFVSQRFRYIGVDLGLSRYTPHSAAEVLANRYGDCKDKHTLFVALLQAQNITASPALISSSYKIDPTFPSPALFDHVITAIPRGDSFQFLDTTPEVAPFGLLLRALRNHQALVVLPSGASHLATTPVDPPIPNYEVFHIDASIDAKGTLDAKMKMEERGDGELSLRLAYRATPQTSWQELTQRIVAGMGFGGTVSDVSVGPPEDTSQPFWLSFNYHRNDYPDWKERRIVLPSPPFFVPDLNEEQKLSKDPLPLGSPEEITYDSTIKFPKGFAPILPQKVERKYDFGEFSAVYSLNEDTLRGTLHFKTVRNEIPGDERSKYSSLTKEIDDTARRYIFVVGNFPPAILSGMIPGGVMPPAAMFGNSPEAIPRLEAALEADPDNDALLMQLSALYCNAGRASDAVTLLKRAMDKHDDVPSHLHLALGKAYLRIPDVEKAMPEFKQGLGDDADADPTELNGVAYVLAEANVHLPEALDYSTRAVSDLSEQSMDISVDAAGYPAFTVILQLAANWDTLGWIKFRSGDIAGAEKYLRSAWEILQSEVIGEHFTEVYEKTGKKEKAAAICNMALSSYQPADSATRDKLSEEMGRLRPFLSKTSGLSAPSKSRSVDGGVALSEMRELKVPFHPKLKENFESATFVVGIVNGRKTNEVAFLSGAEDLRPASAALAVLKFPQSFPDETPAKVVRKAILSCSTYSTNCTLILTLPTDSAVPIWPGQ